jgi:hypothetical protein
MSQKLLKSTAFSLSLLGMSQFFSITTTAAELTDPVINSSLPLASHLHAKNPDGSFSGELVPITITANAKTDGDPANMQYKFSMIDPFSEQNQQIRTEHGDKFELFVAQELRGWHASNEATWLPEKAGDFIIKVEIRDITDPDHPTVKYQAHHVLADSQRFGMDIAHHQSQGMPAQLVDFAKAKARGIEFVNLRLGVGDYIDAPLSGENQKRFPEGLVGDLDYIKSQDDLCFRRNILGAKDAGMPIDGYYIYSYAMTEPTFGLDSGISHFESEATHAIEVLKRNGITEGTVYFDAEERPCRAICREYIFNIIKEYGKAAICQRFEQDLAETPDLREKLEAKLQEVNQDLGAMDFALRFCQVLPYELARDLAGKIPINTLDQIIKSLRTPMAQGIARWYQMIRDAGFTPGIYTGPIYISDWIDMTKVPEDIKIWLARWNYFPNSEGIIYPETRKKVQDRQMTWQFSTDENGLGAHVGVFSADVDLDIKY